MRPARPILVATLLMAAACTQFPEVDASVSETARNTPYPDLVPIETLKERMTETRVTPQTQPALESRVARLKSRAASLKRRSAVDAETKRRMREGVQ